MRTRRGADADRNADRPRGYRGRYRGDGAVAQPPRGTVAEAEARRLAATIQAAVDRSIATGSRDALVADDGGYAVGGVRHALPDGTALTGVPPGGVALGFDDGRPFALVVAAGPDRWTVAFDGLRAVAARAPDRP